MERSCVTTGIVIHLELAYSAFSSTYKAYGATYTATYSADAEAYMIQGLRRILRARLLGLEEQLLLNSFSLKENSVGGNECERPGIRIPSLHACITELEWNSNDAQGSYPLREESPTAVP